MKIQMGALAAISILLILLTAGCANFVDTGELRTETEIVDLGEAQSVRVEVRMGVGVLDMSGGAEHLLDAQFTYNVEEWEPEVRYDVSAGRGTLIVRQPSTTGLVTTIDDARYHWNMRLNDDVPMDLDIELGVGDSQLELGGMSLQNVDIQVGVGDVEIDLTGEWKQDCTVEIQGGVGRAAVRLPRTAGVRVEIDGVLGRVHASDLIVDGDIYTNQAYGEAEVTIDITIETGVGEIDLLLEE